ncbi:uncharacterized protein BJ171DRAFT_484920 [Polychytrium aggregatum]|uniref:uncharacterized protein n=1 Tax=Polychytrium aggregatum TaxID=110093 RepID=UPI0022FE2BB4|nr:uncharacterized protein BJ171DRAFT_484920 [Polychytrium aggregatum]KAI9209756.1 hypothetical protein BJ171DRAFT_484920 [Polychytrium aggregatum]
MLSALRCRLGANPALARRLVHSTIVTDPKNAPSLRPTPLLFLSGPILDKTCWQHHMQPIFERHGYSTILADIDPPLPDATGNTNLVDYSVAELAKIARAADFPPAIIAHGIHSLTLLHFLESHPARAAILLNPFPLPSAQPLTSSAPATVQTAVEECVRAVAHHPLRPKLSSWVTSHGSQPSCSAAFDLLAAFHSRPLLLEPQSLSRFPFLAIGYGSTQGDGLVPGGTLSQYQDRFDCDTADLADEMGLVEGGIPHFVQLDENLSVACARSIIEWLDGYNL